MSDLTLELIQPPDLIIQFPVPADVDIETWMDARPEYDSNGTAKVAFEVLYGVGNAIGKKYWAAQGHDTAPQGAFLRVI